jgi:hypothetical protein
VTKTIQVHAAAAAVAAGQYRMTQKENGRGRSCRAISHFIQTALNFLNFNVDRTFFYRGGGIVIILAAAAGSLITLDQCR